MLMRITRGSLLTELLAQVRPNLVLKCSTLFIYLFIYLFIDLYNVQGREQ